MYYSQLHIFLTKTVTYFFLVKYYVKLNEEMSNNSENTKLEKLYL